MCEAYNGWQNYATWAVHLWLTGDELSYNRWRSVARGALHAAARVPVEERHGFTTEECARIALAEVLREKLSADPVVEQASLTADLLTWALAQVNWQNVASALLEGVEGNEP